MRVRADSASQENQGRPLLDSLAALHANHTRAEAIGRAGRHLAMEVLHPDNVARQASDCPKISSVVSQALQRHQNS